VADRGQRHAQLPGAVYSAWTCESAVGGPVFNCHHFQPSTLVYAGVPGTAHGARDRRLVARRQRGRSWPPPATCVVTVFSASSQNRACSYAETEEGLIVYARSTDQ
jgi:hypothetical protein